MAASIRNRLQASRADSLALKDVDADASRTRSPWNRCKRRVECGRSDAPTKRESNDGPSVAAIKP